MWRLKILAKLALSRLPLGYWTFHQIGVFRHGGMHKAGYAVDVVTRHLDRLGGLARVAGATCLELGPGDSLASALIAKAYGASATFMVDAGDFANRDMSVYRSIAAELKVRGLPAPELDGIETIDEVMDLVDGRYLTGGLASLRALDEASVDLIWSQAVLEHVRKHELHSTFVELRRLIRRDGAMSHRIDFKDHLGGSLNNLRFSAALWESDFMARSGFYTNRVRFNGMVRLLREAGFQVDPVKVDRWAAPPVARESLATEFRDLEEEDLLVTGCDLLAAPVTADALGPV